MEISRRTLLRSTAAVAATGGWMAQSLAQAGSAFAASPAGDVVGKITVGYQGWFACPGDGAPINAWWHWGNNWGAAPSPSNNVIKAWPDMSEYTHTYQTAYSNLNSGAPATLFSSYDQQTVDTHFLWMQQYGCDTAALQRFNPNSSEGPTRDAMAGKVRSSAEKYGRKFYVMYDVTGWTNMQSEIKADWTSKMSAHTASSAYARQNGKPVVCIWGFGFNDNNHPWDAATCLDVVNWFKGQGCYVVGGVPREWRTGVGGSRAGYTGVYHAFNMLSPWMVGAIGNAGDSDNAYTNLTVPDQADCNANGVDYQPCVLPGDVSANQRAHGDFMWRQFYNVVRAGVQGIYISMFDEYGEGNQIAKTAATQAGVPAGSGLLALDSDGTACSSDYYLRLTGDGGKMLKGQIAVTATRPTQPGGGGGTTPPPPPSDLALNRPTSASSANGGFPASSAVDGNAGTYWESSNNAFPQWWQVDLGSATGIGTLSMALPASWGARNQTVLIQGSTDGSSFSTIVGATSYAFDPAKANTVTVTLPATTARYVRLTVSANSGWPAAQLAEVQILAGSGGTTPPPPPSNLALNKGTSASASAGGFPSSNAVDGNTSSYWESANSAFPQSWQVDLGSSQSFSRVVLNVPPASSWATRTQTLSVQGSNDGSSFSTIVGSNGYTFNPSTGNTVTITFGAASYRYLRLNFTGNTGWPAGQLSEVQVWAS